MRSRLEDLIATADRQMAGRSYDAAIDTYRTALLELGAGEAGVEEQLETARRARDEARGIVRPPPPPPAPAIVETAPAVVVPIAEPEPAPLPEPSVQAAGADDRPIEAPAFDLIERPERVRHVIDVEQISILDPKPLPEDPDPLIGARFLVAAAIFVVVCAAALLLR
jgi:hypothetical protein